MKAKCRGLALAAAALCVARDGSVGAQGAEAARGGRHGLRLRHDRQLVGPVRHRQGHGRPGRRRARQRRHLPRDRAQEARHRARRAGLLAQSTGPIPARRSLAKIGKVLGVKYIIAGSITKFATESRGGAVRVKGIGLGGKKAKSEVNLTARLIDATTGEILALGQGPRRVEQGRRRQLLVGRLRRRAPTRKSGGRAAWATPRSRPATTLVAQIVAEEGPPRVAAVSALRSRRGSSRWRGGPLASCPSPSSRSRTSSPSCGWRWRRSWS